LVDKVKNDQGIPASQAQAYVRRTYPEIYQSYLTNSDSTAKRAPATFEDLVNAEMRKTQCSYEISAQRVAQAHGFRAFDNPTRLTKRRGDLLYEFQKRVDEVMYQDGVSADEATRRVRREDYNLYAALQRAG
jgi:hypothetical protein